MLSTQEPETLPNYEMTEDNLEDATRISGTEIAGNPYKALEDVTRVMLATDLDADSIKNLGSFEQAIVGVFLQQLHLMIEKQKKYGKLNISKAGMFGLVTRLTDKVERVKTLVGDPVQQLDKMRELNDQLLSAENMNDVIEISNDMDEVLNPSNDTDESLEDTIIDIANYGLIMYMVQHHAWGKDMQST